MKRILFFSFLLLAGMAATQAIGHSFHHEFFHLATLVCLSYIMVEVGLDFSVNKTNLSGYTLDACVAASSAFVPWLFCVIYFVYGVEISWRDAWLVGLFAAPTSAGVLFTMLAAAGLKSTWVFKKARVLAIFDDLDTVLVMIPLQMIFIGLKWQLVIVVLLMLVLLASAVRWLNKLYWPTGKPWILLYGTVITMATWLLNLFSGIHLEVLLPSFVMGCVLCHSSSLVEADDTHSWLDQSVKGAFMFLVGFSLPRITFHQMNVSTALGHLLALTILSNLGKCIPMLFYAGEVNRTQRLALSVAMFPRGEVGAAVLLVALGYGVDGMAVAFGSLSLALNLMLTGIFIFAVKKLLIRNA